MSGQKSKDDEADHGAANSESENINDLRVSVALAAAETSLD
jgi:hypothetical protein